MVKKNYLIVFLLCIFCIFLLTTYFTASPRKQKNIVLGSSLPTSGITKELGLEVIKGASTWFKHVNKMGGIHGKKIELLHYDDQYEPQNTLKNFKKLVDEDDVFALFSFVGTPTVKKILPNIKESDIPFIAPYTGASFLRTTKSDNIINFRVGYQEEITHIVDYLHITKGLKRFSIFYQNDDYGEEGYTAMVKALKKYDLTLVSEGTYKRNTLSIRHALHEIKSANPQAIIIVGAYKPSALFIKQAKECCMKEIVFAPISFVNANALIQELDYKTQNILFSHTVPTCTTKELKVTSEFKTLLKKYYPNFSPTLVSFEAYLAAKALTSALKKTSPPLTRRRLLDTLHRRGTYVDLGGVKIHFNPKHMLDTVYLSTFENGSFHLVNERNF